MCHPSDSEACLKPKSYRLLLRTKGIHDKDENLILICFFNSAQLQIRSERNKAK